METRMKGEDRVTIIIREEGKMIFHMGPYLVYAESKEDAKEQVERWHEHLRNWMKRSQSSPGPKPESGEEGISVSSDVSEGEIQPVCQNNYYDFETGRCLFVKAPHDSEFCIDYPECMYRVGFPQVQQEV